MCTSCKQSCALSSSSKAHKSLRDPDNYTMPEERLQMPSVSVPCLSIPASPCCEVSTDVCSTLLQPSLHHNCLSSHNMQPKDASPLNTNLQSNVLLHWTQILPSATSDISQLFQDRTRYITHTCQMSCVLVLSAGAFLRHKLDCHNGGESSWVFAWQDRTPRSGHNLPIETT